MPKIPRKKTLPFSPIPTKRNQSLPSPYGIQNLQLNNIRTPRSKLRYGIKSADSFSYLFLNYNIYQTVVAGGMFGGRKRQGGEIDMVDYTFGQAAFFLLIRPKF